MEEIKVADTARYVSFYAYDSADHISPADGITGFTVYYYLNNGSVTAMTTPTVSEKDSTNAKGWYTLAVDEAGMVSAEGVTSINIEASGMDPVAIKVKVVGNTTKEVYDRVGAPVGASISADLVVIDNFVDDLESRLTAARAGYLDNLSVGAVALAATALTDATWTDAKAAFLDHAISTVDTNVDTLLTRVTAAVSLASVCTEGRLAELDGANIPTDVANVKAETALIVADTNELQTDWVNGGRLDLLLDAIPTTAMRGTDNAALAATALTDVTWTDAKAAFIDHSIATVDTNLDTLLTRLTAARAGYLDNLSAGAVALASALATAQTDLDKITGTDGVTLATLQALYAPNKVVPDVAGTAATLHGVTDGKVDSAQDDLDILTGTDGVTLATTQGNYAPNKVVPDVAGTAAGLHSTTDGKVDAVQTDSTAIKAKTDNLPSGISKNVALPKFDIYMVLKSDHVTAATEKTITGQISKDGGAFAGITNVISEVGNGMYTIASGFTQTEMNADVITLKFTETDCDQRIITIYTS